MPLRKKKKTRKGVKNWDGNSIFLPRTANRSPQIVALHSKYATHTFCVTTCTDIDSLSLLARYGGSFDGCLLSDSLEDGVVVVDGVDGVEHRLQTLDAAVVDLGQKVGG